MMVNNILVNLNTEQPPLPNAVVLAAHDQDVNLINAEWLGELAGKIFTYRSTDHGLRPVLDSIKSVQRELYLKESCPVIVTFNLSDKLLNGTRWDMNEFIRL